MSWGPSTSLRAVPPKFLSYHERRFILIDVRLAISDPV